MKTKIFKFQFNLDRGPGYEIELYVVDAICNVLQILKNSAKEVQSHLEGGPLHRISLKTGFIKLVCEL